LPVLCDTRHHNTQSLTDSNHYHHYLVENVADHPQYSAHSIDDSYSPSEVQLLQKDYSVATRTPDLSPLPTEAFATLDLGYASVDLMDTTTEGAEARSSSPMDRNQDVTKNEGSSPSGSSGSSNADTRKGKDSADASQPPSSETGTQDVPSFGLSPFLSQLGLGSSAGNASSLSQFPQFNLDFLNMNAANMGTGGVIAALQGIDHEDSSSSSNAGASGEGVSQQLLLEQVKLAQLQQLQQLQSQIFQQQVCLAGVYRAYC